MTPSSTVSSLRMDILTRSLSPIPLWRDRLHSPCGSPYVSFCKRSVSLTPAQDHPWPAVKPSSPTAAVDDPIEYASHAQPLRSDNADPDLFIAATAPVSSPLPHPAIVLSAVIISPKFDDARRVFPYRGRITSRVSCAGGLPLGFDGVVLRPAHPSASQLVLSCYAECTLCAARLVPQQQCKPLGFYLEPVDDRQGFTLSANGTLTGNATFKIEVRPRKPKADDQKWRCASESLR